MVERVRAFDWSTTPLGPSSRWPSTLRTTVQVMLGSRHPMRLAWGPEFTLVYNDAYSAILGEKHPEALGSTMFETYPEAWASIEPRFEAVLERGESIWSEDELVPLVRSGFLEECYFTFSDSPVLGEAGEPLGVLGVLEETTGRVLSERRMNILTELASRTGQAVSRREVCDRAVEVFERNRGDLPFALLYLTDPAREDPQDAPLILAGAAGLERGERAAPVRISPDEEGTWRVHEVLGTGTSRLMRSLPDLFDPLPGGRWSEPPTSGLLMPVGASESDPPAGVLVAGISPRRPLDANYRAFLRLVANNLGTALSSARSFEEERKRATKVLLSDMTHEFRTPLTLLLAPLEELIGESEAFRPETRERLALMHRNAMRLKKLVGDLLDFSRLEAGSMEMRFRPVDLGLRSEELASLFRSAIEKSGLEFRIDAPPLGNRVYVDPEAWEKILFNLLSNALKFTVEGHIEVVVGRNGDQASLSVRDTGVGIAEEELPRIFQRFHRVREEREGNPEGSGIGLALVRNLVDLHGGTLRVESELGVGSEFTVTLPFGSSHLPPDHVVEEMPEELDPARSRPRLVEARGWSAERAAEESPEAVAEATGPEEGDVSEASEATILLAEDNSDLLGYLDRVLRQRYRVSAARDGEAALAAIDESRPDLVIADVMMPRMSGFQLLRSIREREGARLPVILVSALEEESVRVEALEAGADDYLVKPFSARELKARVEAHLGSAREALRRERELRAEAEARRDEAEDARHALQERDRRKDDFLAVLSHELRSPLAALATSVQIVRSPEATPQEIERARERAARQISYLTRQVDDLLEITRITRGKIELEEESVELGPLLSTVVEDHRESFDEGGVELKAEFPERAAWLRGDPMRLYQIFDNILDNAVDFTPAGGRVSVVMRLRDDPPEAEIEIADTGIGMSRETRERIFEPFNQASPGERRGPGLGLGLALVKELVERHGGSVRADSAGEGAGSAFTVRLPLAGRDLAEAGGGESYEDEGSASRPDRTPETPGDSARSLRVLVIEDHEDFAEALRMSLEMTGHQVEVALDGEEGLDRTRRFRPQVVLCDIGLPGELNGHDVARALDGDPDRRPERLIAISGYGQAKDVERSLEAGFDEHLTKPVRPSELQRILSDPAGDGSPSTR